MDASKPQSPPAQSAARGLNPLSSKVTTVLSTSYADSEFRDALALLDERGVDNNAKTRRRLRLDLQKEVIQSNGEIVSEFGRVADHLSRIHTTLGSLNYIYRDLREKIMGAHEQTTPILDEAASLMQRRSNVTTKQQLLGTFGSHFILSDDEIVTLTSTAEAVDDSFFAALIKAKKISKDCEILLGFEKQTLGLEVMEQTSKNINLAFQKLFKWVQREFKTLNLENPQLNPSIRRAIRVLAERPSLFQSCLDYFADARQRILSDAFHNALTGNSSHGEHDQSVKPIEMAAHDPLRYVGDMFAWIHSATVGEHEALEALFLADGEDIGKSLQSGRANEIWQYINDEEEGGALSEFNALKALNQLVDRDISAASRVLRQRVEQVIQSNEDTILAYRLANLLGFYRFTFSKLLGREAMLLELIHGLETEALRQFRSLVRDHIATLQGEFQQTPSDLAPPDFFLDALKQLHAIMQSYDTSISSSTDREVDFQPILAEAFEPFLAGSESMARGMNSVEGTIFILNCLLAAIAKLKHFEFTRKRVQQLQTRVDEQSQILSTSQYDFFKEGSGLNEILDALGKVSSDAKDLHSLRGMPALQPVALSRASQVLDDFLPSALMDALDKIKHVQDSQLAREVTETAAEKFCSDFANAEELLIAADELDRLSPGGEDKESQPLRTLFPRTAGEIRVLLS